MCESRKIIKDTIHFSSSNVVAQFISLFSAILVARFLGPYLLGVWAGLRIILRYSDNFSLGLRHGMNLQLPFSIGRKDWREVTHIKDTAFAGSLLLCLLITTSIVVIYLSMNKSPSILIICGLAAILVVAFCQEFSKLYYSLFRIKKKIFVLSKANAVFAILNLLLVIFVISKFKLYGLYIVFALLAILKVIYLLKHIDYFPRLHIDSEQLKKLFQTGVPLLGIGFVSASLLTADRLMILKFLGVMELGYYSIALFAANFMLQVPNALGFIMFPRLAEKLGRTQEIKSLKNYLLKPTLVLGYFVPLLIAILYYGIPIIIIHFLPKYVPSLEVVKIMVIGMFFATVVGMQDTFLQVLKKFSNITIIKLSCLLTAVTLNYIFLSMGMGIKGVALGTVITYFIHTTIMTFYCYRFYERNVFKDLVLLAELYSPFLLCVALIFVLDVFLLPTRPYSTNLLAINLAKIAIFYVLYFPITLYTEKRFNFLSEIRLILMEQLRRIRV